MQLLHCCLGKAFDSGTAITSLFCCLQLQGWHLETVKLAVGKAEESLIPTARVGGITNNCRFWDSWFFQDAFATSVSEFEIVPKLRI